MSKAAFRGWISLVCALSMGAAAPVAWAADPPTFTVIAASAFLRDTPSAQAPATYSVFQGQVYPITARNADNSWLQLDYPRAKKGTWILAKLGKMAGSLTEVPVVQANTTYTATTETPGASATMDLPPTAVSTAPSEVCVLLYNDTNGNGQLDSNENAIPGGKLTLLDTGSGEVLQAYTTATGDSQGHCFEGLLAGTYTVAATAPAGYNATSEASRLLQARAGQHYEMTFGAQPSASARGSGEAGLLTAGLSTLGVLILFLAAGIMAVFILRRK